MICRLALSVIQLLIPRLYRLGQEMSAGRFNNISINYLEGEGGRARGVELSHVMLLDRDW